MTALTPLRLATRDGSCTLELLPQFGGRINRFVHHGVQIIAGFDSVEAVQQDRFFSGIPLYPWANRLADGSYTHEDVNYTLPCNDTAHESALHGFLFELEPEVQGKVQRESTAQLTLVWEYDGSRPGYPFAARVEQNFRLDAQDGLRLMFNVINRHPGTVPVGLGWHPCLTLGVPVDTLQLRLPHVDAVQVDERLLPTGKSLPFHKFEGLASLQGFEADTSYHLQQAGSDVRALTVLWSQQRQCGIELWQDAATMPWLHVYIPPDRSFIALEPQSCGINAFNTGAGLWQLEQDGMRSARCGLRVLPPWP